MGHRYPPAVFVTGLLGFSGRYMPELRLLAERQGDFPPDIGLTINSQQSAHARAPFNYE
jgi:hypothetical protein